MHEYLSPLSSPFGLVAYLQFEIYMCVETVT